MTEAFTPQQIVARGKYYRRELGWHINFAVQAQHMPQLSPKARQLANEIHEKLLELEQEWST